MPGAAGSLTCGRDADVVSQRPHRPGARGPGGTQTFETSDPELAHEFLTRAYAENQMFVNAVRGGVWLSHSRQHAGPFYRDSYANSMDVSFTTQPLGHLLVARVVDGRIERDAGGPAECFRPGDVFLASEPHRPHASRSPGVRLDLIGIDLAAVADISGDPSMAVPGRLRLHGQQAMSAGPARSWNSLADFVTRQLGDDEAAASPLVTGSTARLLAACVLTAFPNNAVSEPGPAESGDAHPRTVQRAVAFIDAHAAENIGIAEIAAATCVTPRAAQLAFRRHLDTTPLEYLRRVRLERAHTELLAADPARTTVTAVAYRWGFPSPGRFSAAYQRAYGILPGRTLRCG